MSLTSPAPSVRPSFLSFGYLPIGIAKYDLPGRLFGNPNLIKRLQAPDLMAALDIRPSDHVLDFGCGSGYMTVEMAKLAAKATGIDVIPYVNSIRVPPSLTGRLEYIQTSGMRLPFADASFDRILASEVLPMISEPGPFLAEIMRVLKPDGRLVVANGLGHPAIAEAFATRSPRLEELARRYPDRMPKSYAEYCSVFQKIAGTARADFLSQQQIVDALGDAGLRIDSTRYSPRKRAGEWLSWHQFELYLRTGKLVFDRSFVPTFLQLLLLSAFDRSDYNGGLIIVASPDR
jgi:ubiquinone/menaquinone biosynthesis C-methylase UbiE